jgi:cytoskeletal protein CcmA (bactofilin family)
VDTHRSGEPSRSDIAHIGKSVVIKGELSGSEDLYLDGEVEGSIELRDHSLTIGPNGQVRASINAKDVIIQGKVDGNVSSSGRVELRNSAILIGDISTQRIVIEDGAYFKGGIDITKEQTSRREQPGAGSQAVTSSSVTAVATPASSGFPAAPASSTRG